MSSTNCPITWHCRQNDTSLACSRPTALPSSITGSGMTQMPMKSIHCDAAAAICRRLNTRTYPTSAMAATTPNRLMRPAHSMA